MTSIVIAGYLRSPFQFARKGGLINLRPDDLAAQVLRGLVERLRTELSPTCTYTVQPATTSLHAKRHAVFLGKE